MRTHIASGLILLCLAPFARAEEASDAAYGAEVRFVDLDTRGSKGQVMEYDGKLYRGAHGDAWVSNQGSAWLVDMDFKDIGSGEESASVRLDYKSRLKMRALYERMTHRQNMTDFGIIINGIFHTIPRNLSLTLFTHDLDMQYKRAVTEIGIDWFYDPERYARWISFQYWSALKRGTTPNGYYTGGILYFREANVDNETHEFALGMGRELGDKGAMNLDVVQRSFKDTSQIIRFGNATSAVRPHMPTLHMTAAELRWRFNPNRDLAMTGALTGRERLNADSLYKLRAAVAAFNASYRATEKLSLTSRLYWRYVEIDENIGFRNFVNNNPPANTSQFDKLTAKGDFAASYRVLEKLLVKAGYKVELNHRRDAPAEQWNTHAYYADGTHVMAGSQANSVAGEDVKHIGIVGAKAELPLGIEADAEYQRLSANRAAFVNQPTQADTASGELNIPLPAKLSLYLNTQYLRERNGVQHTQFHHTRNSYRAGLDWEAAAKAFFGADFSYEISRYNTEGWFGATGGNPTPALSGFEHVPGMYNRQANTTAGLHGRFNLPKGLVLRSNGSYTWSTVATPLRIMPKTDPGLTLGDITPGEVRIARGKVELEYTPTRYKHLTARASYRIDDWVDRIDPNNSGRASYTQVGVSAKF